MSRIRFKAFSNCSIMDEDVETGGLYAWQSILKARNVVGLGSTWGIGDGQKVEIRGDSWLPEGKVISPQKSLPLNARVCTLMDGEVHVGWRTGFLLNSYLTKQSLL